MVKYFLPVLLFFAVVSCNEAENSSKDQTNPKAVALNDSAVKLLQFSHDSISITKAISLFAEATKIDSNYFTAYWNKRAYEMQIGQYDNALLATKALIRLKPSTPDFYSSAGLICEMKGDTVNSKIYFAQADGRYKAILDTMQTSTRGYEMLIVGNAINVVMMGEYQKGNELLHKLYEEDADTTFREAIKPYLDKNKQQTIEMLKQKAKH